MACARARQPSRPWRCGEDLGRDDGRAARKAQGDLRRTDRGRTGGRAGRLCFAGVFVSRASSSPFIPFFSGLRGLGEGSLGRALAPPPPLPPSPRPSQRRRTLLVPAVSPCGGGGGGGGLCGAVSLLAARAPAPPLPLPRSRAAAPALPPPPPRPRSRFLSRSVGRAGDGSARPPCGAPAVGAQIHTHFIHVYSLLIVGRVSSSCLLPPPATARADEERQRRARGARRGAFSRARTREGHTNGY